jgi:hypothetical protein
MYATIAGVVFRKWMSVTNSPRWLVGGPALIIVSMRLRTSSMLFSSLFLAVSEAIGAVMIVCNSAMRCVLLPQGDELMSVEFHVIPHHVGARVSNKLPGRRRDTGRSETQI